MKSQDHRSTADDGKAKTRPGIKTSPQVTHPILQLQQLVGNKAVTSMIQRHAAENVKIDVDLEDMVVDSAIINYGRRGPQQGRSNRGAPTGAGLGTR